MHENVLDAVTNPILNTRPARIVFCMVYIPSFNILTHNLHSIPPTHVESLKIY